MIGGLRRGEGRRIMRERDPHKSFETFQTPNFHRLTLLHTSFNLPRYCVSHRTVLRFCHRIFGRLYCWWHVSPLSMCIYICNLIYNRHTSILSYNGPLFNLVFPHAGYFSWSNGFMFLPFAWYSHTHSGWKPTAVCLVRESEIYLSQSSLALPFWQINLPQAAPYVSWVPVTLTIWVNPTVFVVSG